MGMTLVRYTSKLKILKEGLHKEIKYKELDGIIGLSRQNCLHHLRYLNKLGYVELIDIREKRYTYHRNRKIKKKFDKMYMGYMTTKEGEMLIPRLEWYLKYVTLENRKELTDWIEVFLKDKEMTLSGDYRKQKVKQKVYKVQK